MNVLNKLYLDLKVREIKVKWDKLEVQICDHMEGFEKFKQEGKKESQQFMYWEVFFDSIYPVLRDGNWKLHLSAVQQALPLVFAFDRTNYKR